MSTSKSTQAKSPSVTDLLPAACGVYRFTHRVTGDTYIGSAANMRDRAKSHVGAWRRPDKCVAAFRDLIERNGADFTAEVLEITSPKDRLRVEARLIQQCRPTLNCREFRKDRPVRDGKPATGQVNVRLHRELVARMKLFCNSQLVPPNLSALAETALAWWLDRHHPKKSK